MQTPKEVHLDHNKIFYGMIGLLVLESFIINERNANIFLKHHQVLTFQLVSIVSNYAYYL